MTKSQFEIDGKKINTVNDFHTEIAALLRLPEWYGRNLDALWDLLTGHVDTNVKLIWKNHSVSKDRLGNEFDKIISVFLDLRKSEPDFEFILD